MTTLRALLRRIFFALVALLLLFEEWGWEPLAALVARLSRLPFFAWLEGRIRALPPYAALATFFVPALMLVPVKIAALFLIAHEGVEGPRDGGSARLTGVAGRAQVQDIRRRAMGAVHWQNMTMFRR
jgi:hypothetical protein